MPLFPWKEEYCVGIGIIDSQHKHLVELLNAVYDASKVGKGREVLGKALEDLITYTTVHFATEEDYMKLHAYPDYEAHHAEHCALTEKVQAFWTQWQGRKVALTADVLTFLRDWLTNHILGADRKYGQFLASHGMH
jgi:hemerythrin